MSNKTEKKITITPESALGYLRNALEQKCSGLTLGDARVLEGSFALLAKVIADHDRMLKAEQRSPADVGVSPPADN